MPKHAAVGAVKPAGLFAMDWVSVFGAPVPDSFMPGILLELELKGYPVQHRGNTVQVRWDADHPERVEEVRQEIRRYALRAWLAPATEAEREHYLALAEKIITSREEKR